MSAASSFAGKSIDREDLYLLSHSIPAVQIVRAEKGSQRWGPIIKLAPGTQVRLCGVGFNQMTVNVEVAGSLYFVFREDLIGQEASSSLRNELTKLRSRLTRRVGHV